MYVTSIYHLAERDEYRPELASDQRVPRFAAETTSHLVEPPRRQAM